jgi:hypothetical protein
MCAEGGFNSNRPHVQIGESNIQRKQIADHEPPRTAVTKKSSIVFSPKPTMPPMKSTTHALPVLSNVLDDQYQNATKFVKG